MTIELCGCGKPVRYIAADNTKLGSCNKYARCPTYDELREENKILRQKLSAIQKKQTDIDALT